jgi:DnaJ-class molecular chaperone
MEKMENYYELLEVLHSASQKEIMMAYENKITKYNNLRQLNRNQIEEIKLLKAALYILTNQELRNKYNKIMGIKNISNIKIPGYHEDSHLIPSKNNFSDTSSHQGPLPGNLDNEDNLDTLFNIDNSWMKNHDMTSKDNSRRSKNETVINNRVFSLTSINKRPGYSSDFEAELRKPQQGREDKTELKMSKPSENN